MGKRVADGAARDLVESDPADLFFRHVQHVLKVPGYGLALAIGVRGEEYLLGLLGRFAQLADDLLTARQHLVGRLEALLDLHAEPVVRQVAHVPPAGLDVKALAQIALYRPRLRARFNYDDLVSHFVVS